MAADRDSFVLSRKHLGVAIAFWAIVLFFVSVALAFLLPGLVLYLRGGVRRVLRMPAPSGPVRGGDFGVLSAVGLVVHVAFSILLFARAPFGLLYYMIVAMRA